MFSRRRYRLLSGNIGVIVLLALIFSAVFTGIWPGPKPAQAADKVELLDGTDWADTSVKLNIVLDPLTRPDFESILVKLVFNLDGEETIRYVYGDAYWNVAQWVYNVYNDVYASVYQLVYQLPYTPTSVYKVVYPTGFSYNVDWGDTVLVTVYMNVEEKPPAPVVGVGPAPPAEEPGPPSWQAPLGEASFDADSRTYTYTVEDDSFQEAVEDETRDSVFIEFPTLEEGQEAAQYDLNMSTDGLLAAAALGKPVYISTGKTLLLLDPANLIGLPQGARFLLTVTESGPDTGGQVSGWFDILFDVEETGSSTAALDSAGRLAQLDQQRRADAGIASVNTGLRGTSVAARESLVFTRPVTLCLKYDPVRLAGMSQDYLALYRYDATTAGVTVVGRKVEQDKQQVCAQIQRAGRYTVMGYAKTFDDVTGHWSQADVELMAAKRVVEGVTDLSFGPDLSVTRAQFAALLQRALYLADLKPGTPSFSDVGTGDWFYGAVEAVRAAGIINGYLDGSFRPDQPITRQEMAVMISRAMDFAGKLPRMEPLFLTIARTLYGFDDRDQVAEWAQVGLTAAVKTGIIKGRTNTTIVPEGGATRAEGTVMLKRLLAYLGDI